MLFLADCQGIISENKSFLVIKLPLRQFVRGRLFCLLVRFKNWRLTVFWKKKKEPKRKNFILKTNEEVRGSFRVHPSADEPIKFKFNNKIVSISDISAGGLSFKNDQFVVGAQEVVSFQLPGQEAVMQLKLEVIKIVEAKNMCCCQFLDLAEEDEDAICDYALRRQKEELQTKKLR